jgi:hypothetical protein
MELVIEIGFSARCERERNSLYPSYESGCRDCCVAFFPWVTGLGLGVDVSEQMEALNANRSLSFEFQSSVLTLIGRGKRE